MENEVLDRIKKEYNDISDTLKSNFREIGRLEETLTVKRYNYLKELRSKVQCGEFSKDGDVLDYCLEEYGYGKPRKTNEIWLYMLECPVSQYEEYFNIRLLEQDKSKVVILYTDLENRTKRSIVPKENQEEFESTHRVIYGKSTIFDCYDRYYNARREFFVSCLENGQEEAVQMILTKYPKQTK